MARGGDGVVRCAPFGAGHRLGRQVVHTSPLFSNTPLTVPLTQPPAGVTSATTGDSEPAVSIGSSGRMVVGGLSWIPAQVNMWTGTAGSTPSFFGAMDQNLALNGSRTAFGDGDESFDLGLTGTIHVARPHLRTVGDEQDATGGG